MLPPSAEAGGGSSCSILSHLQLLLLPQLSAATSFVQFYENHFQVPAPATHYTFLGTTFLIVHIHRYPFKESSGYLKHIRMAKVIGVLINILNQLFEILIASESSELHVDSRKKSFSMFSCPGQLNR